MSWFWRTPSILARSLMREVAPALAVANAVNSTARSAALNVLVITAPQCDGWLPSVMRTPCQPRREAQDSGIACVFESAPRQGANGGPAGKASSGNFCRRFYRRLTIKGQLYGIRGPTNPSVGLFKD